MKILRAAETNDRTSKGKEEEGKRNARRKRADDHFQSHRSDEQTLLLFFFFPFFEGNRKKGRERLQAASRVGIEIGFGENCLQQSREGGGHAI